MNDWAYLAIAAVMVALNGFFVAAEFALVKVRGSQLDELVAQNRPFAATARWLGDRLDFSLSACQLGITMASLALGWVGEPAFSRLIEPLLEPFHVSEAAIHTFGFLAAFSIITGLHLVIGEQAPKIYALRRPELMVLWCALPLKFFYVLFYPFLIGLSFTTTQLLKMLGVEGATDHDTPHTEAEIRDLVHRAHGHGELTKSEHELIHAVFEFDDMTCRRVMVPRGDVVYFAVGQEFSNYYEIFSETQHTRYPLCQDSLEDVIGIVHIKDLVGIDPDAKVDLKQLARPPHFVPESMPISRLLHHFQRTHQLMAIVIDEHGTVVGVVTLENVLEQIIGAVEDEFDMESPDITAEGNGKFVVQGGTPLSLINKELSLSLDADNVDTISGLLFESVGRVLDVGDKVKLDGVAAEVLDVEGARIKQVRLIVNSGLPDRPKRQDESNTTPLT